MYKNCLIALVLLVAISGCSSASNSNVAENASQAEIDNYNKLIAEEAAKVGQGPEPKGI